VFLPRIVDTMRAAAADTPALPGCRGAARAAARGVGARCDTLGTEPGSITAERDAPAERNERLPHLLLKLRRGQFGTKSEKLPEEQLLFAFEEIESTLAENAADGAKKSPALRDEQSTRRRAGRGRLPATGPGAGPTRRRWCSATHRAAAPSTPRR